MTTVSRTCAWCAQPFTTSTKRVTCSPDCNRYLRTQRMRDIRERQRNEATAPRPAEYPPGYFDPDTDGQQRITRAWNRIRYQTPDQFDALRRTAVECKCNVATVMSVLEACHA